MTDLSKLLDAVEDERTFLLFVEALRADRAAEDSVGQVDSFGRGELGWENHTIEEFLEAALSWAHDSHFGQTVGLADAPPWRKMATFLLAGKSYE
ncbi:MAG: hypothetical protein EHM23_30135 [Acidobacteria bacterium]|nr:MAG: hypothetical protein EHM23_30135 [Acidobacteriota bacterium]